MNHILLVFQKTPLAEIVKDHLEEALAGAAVESLIDVERNEAAAKTRLAAHAYSLIITEAEISADRKTALHPSEVRGVAVAKFAAAKEIPAILLSTSINLSERVRQIPNCSFMLQDGPWIPQLILEASQKVATGRTAAPGRRFGHVEIATDLGKGIWSYTLRGVGLPFRKSGTLQIEHSEMENFQYLSRKVGELEDDWERCLRMVGEGLMKQIFHNNSDFHSEFNQLVGQLGNREDLKIEFIVEKNVHGVALEALYEKKDNSYWMLRNPICRRLNTGGGGTYPLFGNESGLREPLNCLIIESDMAGLVPDFTGKKGKPLQLEKLRHINQETGDLENYLKKLKGGANPFNIGLVERVNAPRGSGSFWETIEELADKDWSIVHYAGHSYHDPTKGGFFFFPSEPYPKAISIETFSQVLRRPRLVYLSSCRSSEASFAYELASQNVGSIVGFRWDIEDSKAAEYAKAFYEALFEDRRSKKSLEYAFLTARRKLHVCAHGNKIWAAPILILN